MIRTIGIIFLCIATLQAMENINDSNSTEPTIWSQKESEDFLKKICRYPNLSRYIGGYIMDYYEKEIESLISDIATYETDCHPELYISAAISPDKTKLALLSQETYDKGCCELHNCVTIFDISSSKPEIILKKTVLQYPKGILAGIFSPSNAALIIKNDFFEHYEIDPSNFKLHPIEDPGYTTYSCGHIITDESNHIPIPLGPHYKLTIKTDPKKENRIFLTNITLYKTLKNHCERSYAYQASLCARLFNAQREKKEISFSEKEISYMHQELQSQFSAHAPSH